MASISAKERRNLGNFSKLRRCLCVSSQLAKATMPLCLARSAAATSAPTLQVLLCARLLDAVPGTCVIPGNPAEVDLTSE